jgi:hypothetical protein
MVRLCKRRPLLGNVLNKHARNNGRAVRSGVICAVTEEVRVEAGYNTSTVALRNVRGYKGEPSARGYIWATLFLEDMNTRT